jgi:hypothetical protein
MKLCKVANRVLNQQNVEGKAFDGKEIENCRGRFRKDGFAAYKPA